MSDLVYLTCDELVYKTIPYHLLQSRFKVEFDKVKHGVHPAIRNEYRATITHDLGQVDLNAALDLGRPTVALIAASLIFRSRSRRLLAELAELLQRNGLRELNESDHLDYTARKAKFTESITD